MPNTYYEHSSYDIAEGSRARSLQIDNIGNAIEAAFDKLPTEEQLKNNQMEVGVDSGTVNTYIVAMPYTKTALSDAMEVVFRANSSNTGAATVNVDNLGAKPIKRADGTTLGSGDIVINEYVSLRYNSVSDTYTIQNTTPRIVSDAESARDSAISSASQAAISESNASSSEVNALISENKAQQWAEEAEDTEIESGQYSAKHHALKAAQSISALAVKKTISETPPLSPYNGQEWTESTTMIDFTWYEDGDSGQWVQSNSAAIGSQSNIDYGVIADQVESQIDFNVLATGLDGLVIPDTDEVVTGGWKDLIAPFSSAKGNGTTEPVWSDMGNGMYGMLFTVGDELFATYHVPHDYKTGTKTYPHVHWLCDIAMTAGDTVSWEITYIQAKGHNQAQSLTGAVTTFSMTYTADGTEVAGEHMVTECSDAQAFILPEVDALVLTKVKLVGASVTGSEKIFGIMADLHYESDGLETNEKAPSFTKKQNV